MSALPDTGRPWVLTELGDRVQSGGLSPTELVRQSVRAAQQARDQLGAYITVCAEEAERQAAEAEAEFAAGMVRGPLHGLPVALKDNIAMSGVSLTAGSAVLADNVARSDAGVLRLLREAGAVIVGKTALDEFAFATVGDGITNPVNANWCSGGSSGGSAVAMAAGTCALALGTDTGGSVRIPAACCQIAGFKPTIGGLPTDGVIPLAWTLDHVGLLAADVASVAAAYTALTGARRVEEAPPVLAGLRLAVPTEEFLACADPQLVAAFRAVVARLQHSGAVCSEVVLPNSDVGISLQYLIVLPEAAAYHRDRYEGAEAGYSEGVWDAIEWGTTVGVDQYLTAQRARSQLHRDIEAALGGFHGLLLPTMPIRAPVPGQTEVTLGDGRREDVVSAMLRFTCLFNHGGQPAISVPVPDSGSTTTSLQVVGSVGSDLALLRLAEQLHESLLSEDCRLRAPRSG